tara:strand:+ start:149 stop:793 length:645 start_codon:yes stop_codon:yes gene_type:complete
MNVLIPIIAGAAGIGGYLWWSGRNQEQVIVGPAPALPVFGDPVIGLGPEIPFVPTGPVGPEPVAPTLEPPVEQPIIVPDVPNFAPGYGDTLLGRQAALGFVTGRPGDAPILQARGDVSLIPDGDAADVAWKGTVHNNTDSQGNIFYRVSLKLANKTTGWSVIDYTPPIDMYEGQQFNTILAGRSAPYPTEIGLILTFADKFGVEHDMRHSIYSP